MIFKSKLKRLPSQVTTQVRTISK